MGKLKSFEIIFDNNKDVYRCGEVVSGKLIADLSAGMKARGVRIRFRGWAFVYWTETRTEGVGQDQRTVTETYAAEETYFNETITVWGKERGDRSGENPTLPPGLHEFPFRYQLGNALPSSFEAACGYVRYFIKGYIDKPWRFDHTTKRAFTVLDLYDLNGDPKALLPAGDQASKTLCCLCCASGPIELQAEIDRVGYCPGESIVVRGSVENNSNTRITNISAKITQLVKFHALTKSTSRMYPLSYVEGPGCDRHQTENIGELVLPIPVTPPSGLRYCSIIDIKYYVELVSNFPDVLSTQQYVLLDELSSSQPSANRIYSSLGEKANSQSRRLLTVRRRRCHWLETFSWVTAHIKGPHTSLDVSLGPLTIGSIPLKSSYGQAPLSGRTVPGAGTPIFHPPPPIYVEIAGAGVSIRDSDDSEYTMGQLTFAPKYIYYDWTKRPQPEHN